MNRDTHFAGLNDIPWAELSSAYENADELPIWIRRLASVDAAVRSDAANHICAEVEHQGSLYSASAAVIPFLIRLLGEPGVEDKDNILAILSAIASAYLELLDGELLYDTAGEPVSVTMALIGEQLPVMVPAALPFIQHDDPAVRMQAARLLTCFPQLATELRPALRSAFERESDPPACISLVLALGLLAQGNQEDVALFQHLLHDKDGLMRFAAAQSLARSAADKLPHDAIELLIDIFLGGGRLWLDAMEALYHVQPERLRFAVPIFVEALVSGQGRGIKSSLEDILFRIGFVGDPPSEQETTDPAYLDALRRLEAYLSIESPPEPVPDPEPSTRPARRAPGPFAPFSDRIRATAPGITIRGIQGRLGGGQNNDIVAMLVYIGDATSRDVIFRFPRHLRAIDEMERELRLLRALQERLPLPIPNPIYSSLEPREVGQAFMGYEKLPGKPLYREMLEYGLSGGATVQHLAEQLGNFLQALHTLPVDEVFDFPLPVVADLETWSQMYADIRAKLFPRMRPDAREAVAAHFETYLADAATFAYTPALVHGDFGAGNILYDAKARSISGIIDWSSAGLGDPALDIAALVCPASYGEDFARRLAGVYPGVADLLPRARFYIGTFALQEALFGVEQGDEQALARGLEQYV